MSSTHQPVINTPEPPQLLNPPTMANSSVPVNFSRLPMEMKINIFAFVREKTTKAAACLVNREWRSIMAPMAFENLTLRKRRITPGMMGTLLDPGNGVTPHVHSLFIARGPWDGQRDSITDAMVQLIIGALPQNGLRAFAGEVTIDTLILLYLLQHQAQLKRFAICHEMRRNVPNIDLRHSAYASWAMTRCAGIESLTVFLLADLEDTYTSAGFFVRNALHLKALRIKDFGSEYRSTVDFMCRARLTGVPDYNVFGGPFEDEDGHAKLELSRMSLEHVNLALQSTDLTRKYVGLPKLKCLQVVRCEKTYDLMTALAPVCNLTKLNITMPRDPITVDRTTQAVEALLNSFSGLRVLWLDLSDRRMVNVSCIAHHGSSLRQLGIDAAPSAPVSYLSVTNLEKLLRSTPHLEGLAINHCPVFLGEAEHVVSNFRLTPTPGEAHTTSDLENYMTTVSAHLTLRYLRILTSPIIRYSNNRYFPHRTPSIERSLHDDDLEITRTVMQHFASQILSYLSTSGSQVQFWGILPNIFWSSLASAGANGHVWPRYYYARRRIIVGGEEEEEKKRRRRRRRRRRRG